MDTPKNFPDLSLELRASSGRVNIYRCVCGKEAYYLGVIDLMVHCDLSPSFSPEHQRGATWLRTEVALQGNPPPSAPSVDISDLNTFLHAVNGEFCFDAWTAAEAVRRLPWGSLPRKTRHSPNPVRSLGRWLAQHEKDGYQGGWRYRRVSGGGNKSVVWELTL